jgi:hypothetical protein
MARHSAVTSRAVMSLALALATWASVLCLPAFVRSEPVEGERGVSDEAQAIKRLDGPTRAKALAALAGLIILGFGMVALIWLGARVAQRYRKGTSYFRPTPRPAEHDWAAKPLGGKPNGDEP